MGCLFYLKKYPYLQALDYEMNIFFDLTQNKLPLDKTAIYHCKYPQGVYTQYIIRSLLSQP